ncbi:MAG: substrate-binding domain-containing protein [Burkholderiales bacterium]|nr:substrate-binding domain-containing protein [Burkholderiales bacterium]
MELKILTSNSTRTVLDALIPAYEKNTGNKVSISADSAKAMVARIKVGETGDVVILSSGAVKELAADGAVIPASHRPFARAMVGVGVAKGTAHPDISTVDALRKSLLAAQSIAHTVHGASGMYIPALLEKLGIAEQMRSKTVTRPGGYIGRVVVAGEAEIALQQIPELLAVDGLELVGPVPDAVQKVFETATGLVSASKNTVAAQAMLDYFATPAHAGLFASKGLQQAAQP